MSAVPQFTSLGLTKLHFSDSILLSKLFPKLKTGLSTVKLGYLCNMKGQRKGQQLGKAETSCGQGLLISAPWAVHVLLSGALDECVFSANEEI